MINLICHNSAVGFIDMAKPFLLDNEAANNLILGIAQRRKGYASALVAAVSQRALDMGKQHCSLFADFSNPTSNHIYQTIGYKPIGETLYMLFEPLPI